MSIETSVDTLTLNTSQLLDVCVALKNGVAQQIADAVLISKNAALTPLVIVATNLINTQVLFVNSTIR